MIKQEESKELNQHKSQKTYQYVFDYFSDQILSGQMKIGDKIAPERDIAEQLGVSRNSIREVMHMLEINGLIECLQGSGNYVRCDPQEYMMKSVHMVMALMDIDYTEVYHIRSGYELVGLRLAIKNATDEEIEGIHQALLNMESAREFKESAYWDHEFHRRLIYASHNRMLILYASMIGDMTDDFIFDLRSRILGHYKDSESLSRSHWGIYEALVNKDYISGSVFLNKHFEVVGKELFNE